MRRKSSVYIIKHLTPHMASFVGASVHITLANGDAFNARIRSVDPVTATMSLELPDGSFSTVRRSDLRDVRIANQSSAPTTAPARAATQAPAAPTPPNQEKRKNRRKPKGDDTPTRVPAVPLEEFDFSKSLQQFDKKKIWEEIRVR